VPDLQATLEQVVALGGKVAVPPTEIPGVVTFAQFTDPEGNLIGLTKG
jgi:predicted enzyme related to lactoylglutathione lyase